MAIDRRKFIRHVSAGAIGTVLAGISRAELWGAGMSTEKMGLRKITILHTNDMHSHIDPFPDNDPKYPGLGGMARRAAMIEQIRKEEDYVLLLDAGDIFQGTPYFNYFGGELEFKLMSQMGYDLATLGNHDFDNGIEGLLQQLPHAEFPFVNANYDFNNTPLKGHISEYKTFKHKDLKTGVFGLGVELAGLVDKRLYGDTVYHDPIAAANKIAARLRNEEKCDLVICLSHLGYDYKTDKVSDRILAAQTVNIDLIIGGHTHTFLENPEVINNQHNKPVLINQVGWAGVNLGRIDFFFESSGNSYITESGNTKVSRKTRGL